MSELEDYLRGPFLRQKIDIKSIQDLTKTILPIFWKSLRDDRWPYEIVDKQDLDLPSNYSFSTNAMICFSLAAITGLVGSNLLAPSIEFSIIPHEDENIYTGLIEKSINKMMAESAEVMRNSNNKKVVDSTTFGSNDPFTLTWLLSVVSGIQNSKITQFVELSQNNEFKKFSTAIKNISLEVIEKTLVQPDLPILALSGPTQAVTHAFPLLRVIQLAKALKDFAPEPFDFEKIKQYLQDRLYLHISYSAIPDSSFDAAELVFSLEAVLLCDEHAIDKAGQKKAFEIIAETQERTPYWRPLRPFVATAQGLALLPLSVEIANSLLRIYNQLDRFEAADSYFSNNVQLFDRYATWLRSRIARGTTINGTYFEGWYSEHLHAVGRIHLWETSQVLLFLCHYASMLQRHIARMSLRFGGFSISFFERHDKQLASEFWLKKWESEEPIKTANDRSQYSVYRSIRQNYIEPRESESASMLVPERHNSMLIYGPPGTAKTTTAMKLAEALRYSFLTITPSDFIVQGEAGVEQRAKNIFETLQEQDRLVILFDEIDRLILDRDSKLYREQGDIFQFMTPGMLTKLKDLRSKRRSIFIIATNYYERIDSAVKRVGRIDDRYLLLPPDSVQRKKIIEDGIQLSRELGLFDHSEQVSDKDMKYFLQKTALATFGELTDMRKEAIRRAKGTEKSVKKGTFGPTLVEVSNDWELLIRLTNYQNRFRKTPDEDFWTAQEPFEEFFLLVYLIIESGKELADEDRSLIKSVVGRIDSKLLFIRDEDIRKIVKDFLAKNNLL